MHLEAWPGGSWLPWRAAPLGCVLVLRYFLRRGGNILLLLPGAHPATDRHTVMVQEIWQPWHPIVPEDTFLSLATPLIQMGGYKAVKKFLTKLKNTMYELVQEPSITYLYTRVQAAVWPGGVNWDWMSMIASLPNKGTAWSCTILSPALVFRGG